MVELLRKLMSGQDLTAQEATSAMTQIMTGEAGEARTAAFLVLLAKKSETGIEIENFARSMRHAAVKWPTKVPEVLFDTCGTGGDSSNTINISTLSAIVLSSLGHSVAKHGNRAVSSATGSADVLEELGLPLDLTPEACAKTLERAGICFLFAPNWHPAMKHAGPVRKALGLRTVFNLLGPLANPAPITHQVVGVFDPRFLPAMAEGIRGLERKEAIVLHSNDGLDEVSIAAPTRLIRIHGDRIENELTLEPEDFGFEKRAIALLKVTDRQSAISRTIQILKGAGSEAENWTIAMNAGLALSLLNGKSVKECAAECLDALKAGKAEVAMSNWIRIASGD